MQHLASNLRMKSTEEDNKAEKPFIEAEQELDVLYLLPPYLGISWYLKQSILYCLCSHNHVFWLLLDLYEKQDLKQPITSNDYLTKKKKMNLTS